MQSYNEETDFVSLPDGSTVPVSTISMDLGQGRFTTTWASHSLPQSPCYDQLGSMSIQQSDLQGFLPDAPDFSQIIMSDATSQYPLATAMSPSQGFYASQPLLGESFVEYQHLSVSPIPSTFSNMGELEPEPNLEQLAESRLSQAQSVDAPSQEGDDQTSYSSASSPKSPKRASRKYRDSSPREGSITMVKRSSAKQCELCDKWVVDMKKHRESHEETRAAKCPLTSCAYTAKGMSRINDIKRHVVAQHWTQGLFCLYCPGTNGGSEPGLYFEKAQAFRSHMRIVHGVQNRGTRDALKMPDVLKADGKHGRCQVCQVELKNYQHLHDHLEACIRRHLVLAQDIDKTNQRNLSTVPNPGPDALASTKPSKSTSSHQKRTVRPSVRQAKRLATQQAQAQAQAQTPSQQQHEITFPLQENANAGNIGILSTSDAGALLLDSDDDEGEHDSDGATCYPSGWQSVADGMLIMHRTVVTFDGPNIVNKESMFYDA